MGFIFMKPKSKMEALSAGIGRMQIQDDGKIRTLSRDTFCRYRPAMGSNDGLYE